MENIKQYETIVDNLLPYPFKYSLPFISRGVTFSNYDKKGGIIANGKCDLTGYPTFICEMDRVMLKANQAYTFSGNCSSEYGFVNIAFKKFKGLKTNISYTEIRDGVKKEVIKNSISTLDNDIISNEVTFIPSEDVYIQFEIVLNSKIGKVSNVTFYPMLEESSTKHKYQPYVKSREGIIEQIIADNLIPYPYSESNHIHNGITWTDNGDGTVHARGVAKGNSIFHIVLTYTKGIPLKNGYYTLSGCPLNGSEDTYYMSADYVKNKAYAGIAGKDYGEGATFEITDVQDGIIVMICIKNGTKVEDLTFKPMLEEGVVAHKYQPYALSRAKIVKDISNIEVGGGGNIEVTPLLTEGVKIGEITTSEKTTELYAPSYEVFGKSGPDASEGLVPAPPKTEGASKYLREDGVWVTPEGSGAYPLATQENDGLMSAADKTKLDNIIEEKLVETIANNEIAIDCAEGQILDLQIYGKSSQSNVPTPNSPVEIKSVGEKGYFTGEVIYGGFNAKGVYYPNSNSFMNNKDFIPCSDDDIITISYDRAVTMYLYFFDKDMNFIESKGDNTKKTTFTTTAPLGSKYFYFRFTTNGIATDLVNIMINNQKYALTVKSMGKNLIKIKETNLIYNGLTYISNTNSKISIEGTSTYNTRFYIDSIILPKGKYNLTGFVKGTSDTFYLEINFSKTINKTIYIRDTDEDNISFTIEEDDRATISFICQKNIVVDEEFYLMLRPSGTDDTYESYKESLNYIPISQPLRSIGEIKDIFNVSENKIVRNVIEKTYNGSEDWQYNSEEGYFYLVEDDIKLNSNIICSHYPFISSFIDVNYGIYINNNVINIKNIDINNEVDFKNLLSTSPISVLYEILEPKIEYIDSLKVDSFNPSTYVRLNDETDMSISYFLNTKDGQGLANAHEGMKNNIEEALIKKRLTNILESDSYFIDILDSAEGKTIDLQISGDSVQSTVPTPSAPVEIISIGSNGFFDGELLQGNLNLSTGVYTSAGYPNDYLCSRNPIPCSEGDSITLTYAKKITSLYLYFYDKNMDFIKYSYVSSKTIITEIAPEGAKFFRILLRDAINGISLNTLKHITLTINNIKYAVVIKSFGKNFIKTPVINDTRSGISLVSNVDGSITISGTATSAGSLYIDTLTLERGIYVLSGLKNGSEDTYYMYITNFSDSKVTNSEKKFVVKDKKINQKITIQFYKNAVINETFYPMLTFADIDNNYESYKEDISYISLSAPLRGIDDTKDKGCFAKGYIVRDIVEKIFNGSENELWEQDSLDLNMFFISNLENLKENSKILCSHYAYATDLSAVDYGVFLDGNILKIKNKDINTLEDWKTWLTSNPITVLYKALNSIIEKTSLVDIKTFNPFTHITLKDCSNLKVSYFLNNEEGQSLALANNIARLKPLSSVTDNSSNNENIDISDFVPGDNITIESDNGKIKISSSDTDTTYAAGIGLKLNNNTFTIDKMPDKTTTGGLGFLSADSGKLIPTNNTLAFWSGCYNTENTKSNLTHCKQGAFGTATIKDWTNYVSGTNENLVTSKGVFDALDALKLGTASTKDYTSYITEGSNNLITSGAVYAGLANKADSEHIRNNYLPLTGGTLSGNLNITKDDETVSQILLQNSLRKGGLSITGAGNLGIYDSTNSKWILSSDMSGNNSFNGNATTATTASKLGTDAGSTTQPVYFKNGIPVPTTYLLEASVPSDAKFTDTTYNLVTTSSNGLMSSTDKTKLDNIDKSINSTLSSAKAYTDEKINEIVGEGASTTLDTIGEISKAIEEHRDVTDAINAAIGNKANAIDLTSHVNATDIHVTSTSKTNWDTAYTNTHTHSNKSVLDNTTASYTTKEKTKLDGIATGAEVNQNAFSNVVVGSTTITADSKTDTLTIAAGSNVTITPDATNDKLTISATDTTYSAATQSKEGLLSASDKTKLDGITSGANKYIHPSYTAKSSGLYKVTVDATGHVSGTTAVAKSDITALGIPAQDTTYSVATTSANGLMSSTDKTKLDGITSGANKTTVDSALSSTSTNPVQNKVINSALSGKEPSYSWVAIAKGQTWSRLCLVTPTINTVGSSFLLSVGFTRGSVVGNATFLITSSHAGSDYCKISQLSSNNYTSFKIRGVCNSNGICYIEIYDNASSITNTTTQNINCKLLPLLEATVTMYTEFTSGVTLPTNYIAYEHIVTTGGAISASKFVGPLSGNASSASKLNNTTAIGSATQPVYFNASGVPVATTYTLGTSVPSGAKFTDTVYTHPTTSGNKHIPSGGSSGQILRWSADGTAVWGDDNNTTYSTFVKSGSGAKAGLVPAPSTTAGTTKYLREDGQWVTPPNTTYSAMIAATSSAAGKAGLVPAPAAGKQTSFLRGDGTWVVPTDTKYTHPSYTAKSSGLYKVTVDATGHVSATTAVAKADITALGIPAQDTTYAVFGKSGSTASTGLVPAPSTTAGTSKYLREDGTWATINLSSATGPLPITKGGTGATTAVDARTNLGLGSAATKSATSSITSGGTGLITSGAVYTALTTGYKDSGEKTTSMSNNTLYNVADTISLTAGVWMIVGGIVITPGSGATIEKAELSINTGDGVLVKPTKYVKFSENNKTNEKSAFEIVDIVKITSTTSYMLKGRVSYNGSSDASTGVGKITAIRIPGV